MRLVLLGPPGAGKGTQAGRVADELGVVHLSSGDILRAERRAKTPLGAKAQSFMDAGQLVPDDVILEMMAERMAAPSASGGFVLDGFPRTLPQAAALDEKLAALGRPIDRVINVEADDAVVAARLTGRWSCPKDGRVYHELFSPPTRFRLCDACGGELVRRHDDEPDVVAERLRTYHRETEPLVAYYRRQGVLATVGGNAEIDAVFAQIRRICRGEA